MSENNTESGTTTSTFKIGDETLALFKERMKLFSSKEDDNLTRILKAGAALIKRDSGFFDVNDAECVELMFEYGRYAYNDQSEFFEENFQSRLAGLSLEHYVPSSDDDGGDDDGTASVQGAQDNNG